MVTIGMGWDPTFNFDETPSGSAIESLLVNREMTKLVAGRSTIWGTAQCMRSGHPRLKVSFVLELCHLDG